MEYFRLVEKKKLSFKEKEEFKQLEKDLEKLEQEKIEHALIPALDFMCLDINDEPDLTLIEQKIKVVHQMMPTSTKLVKGDSLDLLANNVELCLNYDDDYIKRVDNDLQKSSIVAKASIVKLEEWLRNVK